MPIVKASSKYQIAIPKQVRNKLHIKPGQQFVISERDGSVVLTPVPEDPIGFMHGRYKGGSSMAEELLQERARDLEHE